MSDLIYRETAVDAIVGILTHGQAMEAERRIKALPSVDAVPVIYCKDCIRYLPEDEIWGRCTVIPYRLRKKDFCSYAVRKERDGDEERH